MSPPTVSERCKAMCYRKTCSGNVHGSKQDAERQIHKMRLQARSKLPGLQAFECESCGLFHIGRWNG